MSPQQIRDAIAASPELQALGGDTQADANKLLAIAVEPDPVSEFNVRRAVWSDAGEYLA